MTIKMKYKNFNIEVILISPAGSRLYGNARPDSDWDYRGVFILDTEHKLGINETLEQIQEEDFFKALDEEYNLGLKDYSDCVLYELNRFCSLALDNNPNIMDTLCAPEEALIFCSEKGKILREHKSSFISTKMKYTFSGYAISQLKRIKGHNKYINEFPEISEVLQAVRTAFENKLIDFDWITDQFGGNVAIKTTNETAQNKESLNSVISWESFKNLVHIKDIDKYRIPRLIDYMKAYDLTHKELPISELQDLLTTGASFRKFGESTLSIFTEGKGIFGKEGNLKANDSEHIGEFVCLLSVNHNQYKADKDHINKMWNWKCNRNEKRGELEDKYGFDLKHAGHLVRLMEGAKEILTGGDYNPVLDDKKLSMVNAVKNGEWTYEEVLQYAENLDEELNDFYRSSSLRKKPDYKAVNKMVKELQVT
jgi:predicted nucleotidyltransferase